MLILLSLLSVNISATESTSYTYTQSVNKEWVRTQDAYMPGSALLTKELTSPNDIFIYGDYIYISDTTGGENQTGKILIYNTENGEINYIGEDFLKNPSGLFVNEEAIFVADKSACAVYKLSHSGEVLMTLTRPESYLFSEKSQYIPTNVVVTDQGIIFVCGEGSYEGLMQFDSEGVFEGYFAANATKLTFGERIQELIFNEEQMESLLNRIPNPILNMDISDRGLVYSVTQLEATTLWSVASQTENAVKYHNMAGADILSSDLIEGEHNFSDVAAFRDGLSFAVTSTGIIYEYDDSGNVIFSFGGLATSDRSGHFVHAVAIDIDSKGNLYILDKERALIQVFFPTEFADSTHQALFDLSQGNYKNSEEIWLELLSLNGMSYIAHNGYGKMLYQQMRFKEAAEEFKIIKDKESYSECIWEIRNIWFQNNLSVIFIAIILIAVVLLVIGFLKKKGLLKGKEKCKGKVNEIFKTEWSYIKGMIKNPFDEFYCIRKRNRGSVTSATVLFVLAFVIYICDMLTRSFTFRLVDLDTVFPLSLIILFIIPAILWVIGNFMVSTISEGEGTFSAVYTATAYSLVPYILIGPFVIIATYIFTLNEAIIIQLLWYVAIGWSAVLLVLSVKEVHNYNLKETVKIILLTLFFMIMAIIVCVIIFLIAQQTFIFLKDIINEVSYRAKT